MKSIRQERHGDSYVFPSILEVPKLPEIIKKPPPEEVAEDESADDEEEEDESYEPPSKQSPSSKSREKLKSGPPAADPYAEDNSSYVVPIMVAFAVFIPSLFCVCRL